MLNPMTLSFEFLELGILLLLLRHALRAGGSALARLLAGAVFGWSLEAITIYSTGAYQYGDFSISILNIPILVGIGWTNQLYAARLFSDATSLPVWLRPVAEALLAIYLDLLVEPVATRLGFWDFGLPPSVEWFGTPYGNFLGFFWLVVSFGLSQRVLERLRGTFWRVLGHPTAIIFSLAITLSIIAWLIRFFDASGRNILTAAILGLGAVAVAAARPKLLRAPPAPVWQAGLISLGYLLALGLLTGVLLGPPRLLAVWLLVAALGVGAYVLFRRSLQPAATTSDRPG